jgi:hypothetical protein
MSSKMEYEVEKLRKALFIGETLVWGARIKTTTPRDERMNISWTDRTIYFTDRRILWQVGAVIPPEIRYDEISRVGKGTQGSGGFAGLGMVAGGGGVIDVCSTRETISLQFQEKQSLDYANWLINEGMRGTALKRAEGVPEVAGEKDPNAPPAPPPQTKSSGCFIATAAFGESAGEVALLRAYRDVVLMPSPWGRRLVAGYYRVSPQVARAIERSPRRRLVVRTMLRPVADLVKRLYRL